MNIIIIVKRILLFPIYILERRVKQTNWYRSSIPNIENYPNDKWYRVHHDRNYDVVNLGSSSALFCFNYEGLDIKAFNWALKPQSMEYSFKVLKQYFSILRQNGIVIIPFSPFSGLSVTGKWAKMANDKYYHILDSALIDNYPSVANRREHPLLASTKSSIKYLINDTSFADMYSYNVQCRTDEEFSASAKQWIGIWMRNFDITDLNEQLSDENLERRRLRLKTVQDIIDFCTERDLRPVIVLPPVHQSLYEHFTDTFVQNYITSFLKDLDKPFVKVFNYLNVQIFSKGEFFRDAYIMNEKGAKLFTMQVLNDLGIYRDRQHNS